MAKKKAVSKGRPKGSRNKPVEGKVTVVPPHCPHCSSTNINALRGSKPVRQEYAHFHPIHGHIKAIEKQRTICSDCGRVFMKHTYWPSLETQDK